MQTQDTQPTNNPFKELMEPFQKAPDSLKDDLMEDLQSIILLIEFSELFSQNYLDVVESFFKNKKNNNPS